MESIQQAKFEQNPALMRKLTDTGNRILINGNNKQETFWGLDLYSWQGDNQLGKILMNIRRKGDLKMKYDIRKIKEIIRSKPDTEIIYFWCHAPNLNKITAACLSQWYYCYFEMDGVQYFTTEQYMMASKGLSFGDNEVYLEIMESSNPHDYKKLGRKVRNFEPVLWDSKKYGIVVEGNKAKFSHNPDLKEFLLSTSDAILVEASPYDKIWGIGLDRVTAMKDSVEQWQGENLLGFALMEVRDWLRSESVSF